MMQNNIGIRRCKSLCLNTYLIPVIALSLKDPRNHIRPVDCSAPSAAKDGWGWMILGDGVDRYKMVLLLKMGKIYSSYLSYFMV